MSRDSLYLVFVPNDRLAYQARCEQMLIRWILAIFGAAIITISTIFLLPDARGLHFMIRPLLLYPFIPFAMFVAAFFAIAAFMRLKWRSKLDTTVLVWIGFSAAWNMAAIVHYIVAAMGHSRDVSDMFFAILLISLAFTLLVFSRFLFVGWRLLRKAEAEGSSS